LLPGFLLFGAATTLFYHTLDGLTRLLLADITLQDDQEGIGTQGLRKLGRGVVAGTIGDLLFTVVMVQLGVLLTVAGLVNLPPDRFPRASGHLQPDWYQLRAVIPAAKL
jgi:hypothetical protein